jgi:hypothetical protein
MLGSGTEGEIGEAGPNTPHLTSVILGQVLTQLYVEKLLPTPPPRLHHFTSLGTAYQIIEKDNVRLSHAEYSNDQTEMAQAKEIILSALRSRAPEPFFGLVLAEFESRVPELDAYIFCMSMDKLGNGQPQDILSQWRAYGQDGRGVSLTLDVGRLNQIVYNVPGMRINPVIYDREVQRRFVDGILDAGLVFANSAPNALDAMVAALVFATPLMKAWGFEEEREWRLVFMPPALDPAPHLQFHARRDFLAPFFDLTYIWNDLRPVMVKIDALRATLPFYLPNVTMPLVPIQEVMIGPSSHQDLNLRGFNKLLRQSNRATVKLARSQIPYRSLG